jgi:hypothetical protein
MADTKVVRLDETEIVKFGADAYYQPIIGDDEGTTPIRTGIQTSQPGYVAPMHSHPYLEILHILDGVAEAWVAVTVIAPSSTALRTQAPVRSCSSVIEMVFMGAMV